VSPRLHYVHDPLCGWCYAAAPLVKVARESFEIVAHAGGMLAGAGRRAVTPEWRSFVMPHDNRIALASGQPFGPAYFDGLLRDHSAILDSAPPTTAMLAADQLGQRGLDLLARMQTAHYLEGRRLADRDVLTALALEIGLERESFVAAFERMSGASTESHFAETRRFLARVGGNGFPTFALETGGAFELVGSSSFLGKPDAWREHLVRLATARAD